MSDRLTEGWVPEPGERVRWGGFEWLVVGPSQVPPGDFTVAQDPATTTARSVLTTSLSPIPDEVEVTVRVPREEYEAVVAVAERADPNYGGPDWLAPERAAWPGGAAHARFRAALVAHKEAEDRLTGQEKP